LSVIIQRISEFLKLESASGLILMGAALLALLANNSPLSPWYDTLLSTTVAIQIGELEISKALLLWINDGLMAVFFFLVGLEIKRELIQGELSSFDKAALPAIAAIGGMAVPALIFVGINWGSPDTLNGWAIPAATDIAFALGILMLLGNRVPLALKVMLLAVAIIDDLGAILIIALFYTSDLSLGVLGLAAIGFAALVSLNLSGVRRISPYVLIGIVIWVCVLKSGIHATLAGVLIALTIPLRTGDGVDAGVAGDHQSPLHKLEHDLHPWIAYMVLPLFAFANAGVSFSGMSLSDITGVLPLGIALGLIIGKPLGVFGFSYLAVKSGLVKLPEGLSWAHVAGLSAIAGIGFTMSLFIGTLAFNSGDLLNEVRIGVLLGSTVSALAGYFFLRAVLGQDKGGETEDRPVSSSGQSASASPS
jgi:NhaA family Na+:H+ antiporter